MAEIRNARRCGNSTRQIDEWVQELFNNGKVTIEDHSLKNQGDLNSLYNLKRRLHFEHDLVVGDQLLWNSQKKELRFNPKKFNYG